MSLKNFALLAVTIAGSIALQGRANAQVFGDVPGALAASRRPSIMLAYYDPSTGRYVNENLGNSRIPLTSGNRAASPSEGSYYPSAGGNYHPLSSYGYGTQYYPGYSYPGYSYGYSGYGSPYYSSAFGGGYPLLMLGTGRNQGTSPNGRVTR